MRNIFIAEQRIARLSKNIVHEKMFELNNMKIKFRLKSSCFPLPLRCSAISSSTPFHFMFYNHYKSRLWALKHVQQIVKIIWNRIFFSYINKSHKQKYLNYSLIANSLALAHLSHSFASLGVWTSAAESRDSRRAELCVLLLRVKWECNFPIFLSH